LGGLDRLLDRGEFGLGAALVIDLAQGLQDRSGPTAAFGGGLKGVEVQGADGSNIHENPSALAIGMPEVFLNRPSCCQSP
jgi:hypothetical protein